jgi:hypothetical protein
MAQPLLFTPITLRGLTLKNRVVVAPMHQYAAEKGFTTDWHLMNAWLLRRRWRRHGDGGIHQGGAARLRHRGRYRPVGRRRTSPA